MLALAMAVCGLAAGVVLPTTYALAGDLAPQDLRSRAVGRVIVGWSVAMVLGVPAAALLAEQLGWRGAYAIIAGVAGIAELSVLSLPAADARESVVEGKVVSVRVDVGGRRRTKKNKNKKE